MLYVLPGQLGSKGTAREHRGSEGLEVGLCGDLHHCLMAAGSPSFFPMLASSKRILGDTRVRVVLFRGNYPGRHVLISVYILKLLGLRPKSTEVSGSLSTYPSEL